MTSSQPDLSGPCRKPPVFSMRSAFVPSWSAMRIPVLGIISERDIARAVARRGAAVLNEPVSQHMTAKVVTCTRSCTVSDLMELMTNRRIRHVPIVEHGRLSGIISIGDVVKHRVAELEAEGRLMHDYTATEYSAGGTHH